MNKKALFFLILISTFLMNCNTDIKLGGYIEPYGNDNQPADATFFKKEKENLINGSFELGKCDIVVSKNLTLAIEHESESLQNYDIAVFISGIRVYNGKYQKVINIRDIKLCGADNNMASMTFYVFDDINNRIHKFSDGEWTYPILDPKFDKLEIELLPERKTFKGSFRTDFVIKNIPDKIEYEEKRNSGKK